MASHTYSDDFEFDCQHSDWRGGFVMGHKDADEATAVTFSVMEPFRSAQRPGAAARMVLDRLESSMKDAINTRQLRDVRHATAALLEVMEGMQLSDWGILINRIDVATPDARLCLLSQ